MNYTINQYGEIIRTENQTEMRKKVKKTTMEMIMKFPLIRSFEWHKSLLHKPVLLPKRRSSTLTFNPDGTIAVTNGFDDKGFRR